MVKIVIENLAQKELMVINSSYTILRVAQENFIDWMHACGGKGRCTTCKVVVTNGMNHLSPLSPAELNYQRLGQLIGNERLACQTRVLGSCSIRIPDENKMPHMKYSF